ncbi:MULTISPECIES: hypothetical protein [Mesorhizobium]|uniref:DUF2946 domain-containing protein n=1 Tax=Mesorhizobium shonense TaxID=1209948 RepID=A0ABV2HXZ5_9HYPH|nr:hypothetical protein [Mesorhizobium sp.]RWA67673.1 MAG: hypothetical protein EOQ29_22705 [Mesorhizobium sp.]RWA84995.1 MAG: hypothetical protein EOQ30_06305 [Mesorhizobium sp.]RWB23660.1 MAG: hypothetical protein EOQ40_01815 [Mesorhizobium sp.]RWD99824.1 MAG: hypothetical protein EOS40_18205 [Mesorhizobium sp.]TIS47956.1 MAG: hypothetical protein E5W96_19795 [Mesorhizobium sp.]
MPAAFVAALLLLVQSALGAFAFGGPSQLDAFGNIICTHEGAVKFPGGDPHQQNLPACCSSGCPMVSPAHFPPPDSSPLVRAELLEAVAFPAPAFRHLDFARTRSPANPRAPPAIV